MSFEMPCSTHDMHMDVTVMCCITPLGSMYCSRTSVIGQAGCTQMMLGIFMWANKLSYLAYFKASIL